MKIMTNEGFKNVRHEAFEMGRNEGYDAGFREGIKENLLETIKPLNDEVKECTKTIKDFNENVKDLITKQEQEIVRLTSQNILQQGNIEQLQKTNGELNDKNISLMQEIERLKENIREVYSCKSTITQTKDEVKLEVAKEPIEKDKTKKKSTKKVVDENAKDINEKESAEIPKKSNKSNNEKPELVVVRKKDSILVKPDRNGKVTNTSTDKTEKSKKRGRKSNVGN